MRRRPSRIPDAALDYFRKQGARGGKVAARNSTPDERRARARKTGQASGAARAKRAQKKKASA